MVIRLRTWRLLTTACFLLAGTHAKADLLTNGSFENTNGTFVPDINNTMVVNSGSSVIPGWTATNGVPLAWINKVNPWNIPASDGNFFLDLTSYFDVGTYGGVTQTFATTAGTTYTVTFDIGYGGNSGLFGGPVSVRATAAGFSGTFASGSGTPNPGVWDHESFNFTAASSSTQLTFIGISTAGGDYIGLDNAHVNPATVGTVPEPTSLILLGTALVGVAFCLRKTQSRIGLRA